MFSVLRIFTSYRMMEAQLVEVKKERDELLNRLLHAYSGYELRQRVPSYAEAMANGEVKITEQDKVLGHGVHSTIDLMKELEDATLQAAEGIEDITVDAARKQAQEDAEQAAQEYERNLIRARQAATVDRGVTV